MSDKKLCVVVRAAMVAGLKCAQACHALRLFGALYPAIDREWYESSNNIVILQHEDPPQLADALEARGIKLARFFEPDLDGQLTAICVEPAGRRYLSEVPLARA